jgi:hypothetical protein
MSAAANQRRTDRIDFRSPVRFSSLDVFEFIVWPQSIPLFAFSADMSEDE